MSAPIASDAIVVARRYRVRRAIARSDQTTVYEACDVQSGARVAIKMAKTNTPPARTRWSNEAAVLRRIAHDAIVQLRDVGDLDDGRPFLALEYVDGVRMDRYVTGRLVDARLVLWMGVSVVEALGILHAADILHCDIKPRHILAKRGMGLDQPGAVKLIDFGSMRDGRDAGPVGRVEGSPTYMAPEQLAGDETSLATDFYGLGVALYELIVGDTPWPRGPVLRRRLTEEVAIPELPGLPGLRCLLSQLLRREPRDRPHAAADVARALREVIRACPYPVYLLPRAKATSP
jgi:serine/threonine protein kinase